MERTFGQFARVLVEMDVTQDLRYKVLVERKGYAFFVDLDYENIPDYCTNCKKIGHYLEICRFFKKNDVQETAALNKGNKVSKQVFVQTKDGRTEIGNNSKDPIIVEELANTNKGEHDTIVAGKGTNSLIGKNMYDVLKDKEEVIQQDM